jgi:hypothetical protein
MDREGLGIAAAITGFGVWQVYGAYTGIAPSLKELRESGHDETCQRQRLMDAGITVGGTALLAACVGSWLSRSWVPLIIIAATLGWVMHCHYQALKGPTPDDIDSGKAAY